MTKTLTTAIALALLGAATGAQAQTVSSLTTQIRFADLNLSSQAGQAELDRRIESATRRICDVAAPASSRPAERSQVIRCKANVREQVAAALPS